MPWKDKLRSSTDNTSSSTSSSTTGTTFYDTSVPSPTNSANAIASTPSPSLPFRQQKSAASFSMLNSTAQQWAYQRAVQSTSTTARQLEADMLEVRNVIANYAVEPLELLHLVDRWLQQLLEEFYQQRDQFKHRLGEYYHKQELASIKYDDGGQIRTLYAAYKELETAQKGLLSHDSFDEMNSYLDTTTDSTTELKDKFSALVGDYLQILQCLKLIDREVNSSGADEYIMDIENKLLKLKQFNDKDSQTICIVGLEKAGKSTFINALLGYEFLPTASERCTQVRTVLRPPLEQGDQQLLATVKFYDDQEFDVLFNKMIKKTDDTDQQFVLRKEEAFRAREMLRAKFPEEHFRMRDSSDRKSMIKQLNTYITGELYVNIIKEVTIYTDKLPGKNYELLDIPGFDSPIKEHRDAGLEAVKLADAFLFLTNGQQPSLTEPQIDLLREIQQNHFEAMQRAFAIVTKLDLCQTASIYREHREKTYAELANKRFRPDRIFAACARIQIINEHSEEFAVIERKLHSFGSDLLYGFERSKESLNQFIEYELPKTHLKQLIDIGRTRLSRAVSEQLEKIEEKQLIPASLSTMSLDEYIKQKNVENWDRVYCKEIFQPTFDQANVWHTTVVTKDRAGFIDDAKRKFRETFLELTKDFIRRTFPLEQAMFEKYGVSKLQLNVHPIDNSIREKLSGELETIVDRTSDVLVAHFFHKYICEMENMLNSMCSQVNDLFRTKVTLEKCTNETHALVLRVCRPVIIATLRYSYLDLSVKQDAINEFIYLAPNVAFNIVHHADRNGDSGLLSSQILASAESLVDNSDMTTSIIKALFKK